jgi:plasmid segregation protein ParM
MSGSLNLYSDFINAINGEFSLNKVLEDAEDTLVYGLQIYGEKQNLAFTQDIINTHIDKIFEELNLYPIKSSKVMFTGGACKALKPVLQARIKNCIFQTNYLTATAEGFKRVGEMLWPRF